MPWGDPEPVRLQLPVPGIITLLDGRRISAELQLAPPPGELPRGALEVLLDADTITEEASMLEVYLEALGLSHLKG